MATTALGSAYVLSRSGADELIEIDAGESAPIFAPGFVPAFVSDRSERKASMRDLESRLSGGVHTLARR